MSAWRRACILAIAAEVFDVGRPAGRLPATAEDWLDMALTPADYGPDGADAAAVLATIRRAAFLPDPDSNPPERHA